MKMSSLNQFSVLRALGILTLVSLPLSQSAFAQTDTYGIGDDDVKTQDKLLHPLIHKKLQVLCASLAFPTLAGQFTGEALITQNGRMLPSTFPSVKAHRLR